MGSELTVDLLGSSRSINIISRSKDDKDARDDGDNKTVTNLSFNSSLISQTFLRVFTKTQWNCANWILLSRAVQFAKYTV